MMPTMSYAARGLTCRSGHDEWKLQSSGRWRCRICSQERSKRWADQHREQINAAHRAARYYERANLAIYGITLEDKERMWVSQNQCCAICFEAIPLNGRMTAVDHDHKSGKVRGLLCVRCNSALGHMRDDPTVLASAIRYLEGH